MPEYKRQHYLPSVYLKHFSSDAKPTRKSLIWRYDGQDSRPVHVESQCAGNYFYSKHRPAESEKMFQNIEGLYGKCVEKVKAKQPSTMEEYFGLILMMVDLHLRGAAYENATGKEGIQAYASRFDAFKRGLLLGGRFENPTDVKVAEHLRSYWRVRVLESLSGNAFITSDHPAAWFVIAKGRQQIDLMMLPITSRFVAVAYDNRAVDIVNDNTTPNDEGRINRCQAVQALRCVYAASDFDKESKRAIQPDFKNKSRLKGKVDAEGWQATLLHAPHFRDLSFIRSKTPLM